MNLLANRRGRKWLLSLLYFSEGAPIGFIWWALPTLLRSEGAAVADITSLTALMVLPWTCKFLWAPLIDAWRSPAWGFRAWILFAQLIMGLSLLPLLALNPRDDLPLVRLFLLLHAFSAATQDIAIDALAIKTTSADERGLLTGCMQAGMLAGRSLFGGGALLIASALGWNGIIIALCGCILTTSAALAWVREPDLPNDRGDALGSQLKNALKLPNTWWALAFALISGAAFEAAGALAGPFLVDGHASKEAIGAFFAGPVVVATLIGGLFGGKVSDRFGRLPSVAIFLVGYVLVVVTLGTVGSFTSQDMVFFVFAVYTLLYLFIGMFVAASYAMFMDLTEAKISATQFSTFMAATNGCEAWSTWAAGQIVALSGYTAGFLAMGAVSLASLPLLHRLAKKPPLPPNSTTAKS